MKKGYSMTIKNRLEKLEKRHGTSSGRCYFAVQQDGNNYEIGGKVLSLPEIQSRCKDKDLLFIVDRDESSEYGRRVVKHGPGVTFQEV